MSAIKRVTQHFKDRPDGVIYVPEWGDGDEPLAIYWSPLTMQERYEIGQRAGDNDYRASCLTIIRKARDSAGNPLFEAGDDLAMVRGGDLGVVARIALAMTEVTPYEEVAKN